jgi:hypothetical protein
MGELAPEPAPPVLAHPIIAKAKAVVTANPQILFTV